MKKLIFLSALALGIMGTYACAQNDIAEHSTTNASETTSESTSETEVTRTENGETPTVASGNKNAQTREVGAFSELDIALNVETRLVQGAEDKVVVEIDDNLQKNIVCTNKNGKLTIEEKGSYTWKKTSSNALVTVYFKDINKLTTACNGELSGSVNHAGLLALAMDNNGETKLALKAPDLKIETACNGSVTLTGEAAKASIENDNNGSFDAKALKTETLTVDNSANGSMSVFARAALKLNHSGNGSFIYYGNPSKKEIDNSGNGAVTSR
jgi:Putative auto-transporter adhesin, head GIN domain